MFVSPPNSYVEALTPRVMVLGGGAFGKMRSWKWSAHDGISVFSLSLFPSLSPFSSPSFSPSPSSPCEDRVRRWPSASQEEGLTKSRTSWHTDGGTSQSPEMWEIKFCWLKHWEELIKSSDGLLRCGHSNAHQGVWVIGVKKRDNLKFNSLLSFTNCVNVSNLLNAGPQM